MIKKQPTPHEWAAAAQAEVRKRFKTPGLDQWLYALVKRVAEQERKRAIAIARKVEADYPPQVFSDPTPPQLAHVVNRIAREIDDPATEVDLDEASL